MEIKKFLEDNVIMFNPTVVAASSENTISSFANKNKVVTYNAKERGTCLKVR